MGGGNPPTLPRRRQRPASWGPAAQEIPAASVSEGAGVAPPSRDSSPQAGAAPWWAVSGTAVWASPVCLRPGHPPGGGSCPSRAPAGISVSWGVEGVNSCPRDSQVGTCQGASKDSKSPLSGAGSLGAPTAPCMHRRTVSAQLPQVPSAGPGWGRAEAAPFLKPLSLQP